MIGCVRNSDEHLRRLEREAASGDPSAHARLAVAQERTDRAVGRVRDWISERLDEANGQRDQGLVGDDLVRDVVFRAAGMRVHGRGGERPHYSLPLRSSVHGRWDEPNVRDLMTARGVDTLDTTYVLAVWEDETSSVVLGIRRGPGFTLHGAGSARWLNGPLIQKAWPSLERMVAEERTVVETEENWAGDRQEGDEIVDRALAAANSVWRAWRRNMADEAPDGLRIPLEIVNRWIVLDEVENPGLRRNPARNKRIPVRICKIADEAHRTSERAYAHVFCGPGSTICVASAFFDLPREHRDGILAHELGHLFAGSEGDEPAADAAFLERTGVKIHYKDGRHGQCLQCLAPSDSRRLEGRFDFDFSGRLTGVETERDETSIDYVVKVTSSRSFSRADLARALKVDPTQIGGDDRWRGRSFEWTAPSLAEAAQQAAAVRRVLPSTMSVRAFARESDGRETRELGWSA